MSLSFAIIIKGKDQSELLRSEKSSILIGRSKNADFSIDDVSISRSHCKIKVKDNQVWIKDLKSSYGTFVNGEKLAPNQYRALKNQDQICFAKYNDVFYFDLKQLEVPQDNISTLQKVDEKYAPQAKVLTQEKVIESFKDPNTPRPSLVKTTESTDINIKLERLRSKKNQHLEDKYALLLEKELEEQRIKAEEKALEIELEARDKAEHLLKKTQQEVDEQLRDLKIEKETLESNVNNLSEKIEELKTLKEQIAFDHQKLSSENNDFKNSINDLKQELDKLSRELDKTIANKHEAEQNLEKLEEQSHNIQNEIDTNKEENKKLLAQKDGLNEEINKLQKERKNLEEKIDELWNLKLEETKILDQKKSELSRVENEIQSLQLEIQKKQDRLEKREEDIREEQESLRNYRNKIDQELQDREKRLKEKEEIIYEEIDEIRLKAQKESEQQASELLSKAHENAQKIVAEAQEKVVLELEQYKQERLNNITKERDQLQDEVSKLQNNKDELHRQLKDQQTEIQNQIKAAKAQLNQELNAEREKTLAQAEQEKEQIIDKARSWRENFEQETLKMREESLQKLENEKIRLSELKKSAEKEISEAKEKAYRIIEQAKKTQQDYLEELKDNKNKSQQLITKAQEEAEKKKNEILKNAKADGQKQIEEVKKTIRDHLKQHEQKMSTLELAYHEKEKNLQAQLDLEEAKYRDEKIRVLTHNVEVMLSSYLNNHKDQRLDLLKIRKILSDSKILVRESIEGNINEIREKGTETFISLKKESANKDKKFWKKTAIISATSILLIISAPQLFNYVKTQVNKKDSSLSQGDYYIQKVKEERANRPVYQPAKDSTYKQFYYQNYLYTSGYSELVQAEIYGNEWLLELNNFLVNRIDRHESTIVKFIQLEKQLYRDFEIAFKKIDPKDPKPGIAEIKKIEEEFNQKIIKILGGAENFNQFLSFKERFYHKINRELNFKQKLQTDKTQ